MKFSTALLASTLLATALANKLGVTCLDNYGRATAGDIQRGINDIHGWGNQPIYVDGHACVQLSCINNSGVVLCNDNDWQIAPMSDYIASYAGDIIDLCGRYPGGQEFDSDGYNVIVGTCR
ncbi:hypothetical protein H2201_001371 [Coniosporium apollinis]|uniref:Cyanovirin-N domain-containing protein n=1 Tax=Coniosporium apollinis TaxID=61459 RepID=A0ABQ9P247_9PEZI|nr:hypothetical protein H2201_001371 [Coniosporium apollinis]